MQCTYVISRRISTVTILHSWLTTTPLVSLYSFILFTYYISLYFITVLDSPHSTFLVRSCPKSDPHIPLEVSLWKRTLPNFLRSKNSAASITYTWWQRQEFVPLSEISEQQRTVFNKKLSLILKPRFFSAAGRFHTGLSTSVYYTVTFLLQNIILENWNLQLKFM